MAEGIGKRPPGTALKPTPAEREGEEGGREGGREGGKE